MKKLKLFFACLLMAVLSIGQVWAAEQVAYTLAVASTGGNSSPHNSYTAAATTTISGIEWSVLGNSNQSPWRLGGKESNCSGVDRDVHSNTAISDNISKIEITHGTASNITVNSMTVIVSKNSDFSSPVSTLTPEFVASDVVTVTRPEGKDWSNCYFKFVYNLSVSGNSNKFVQFSGAVFYKETGGTPTCATPTFSPAAGAVASGTQVTISCSTDGAAIHYTTNGDAPTASSPTYSNAITVSSATTIKAIAVKDGLSDSEVATAAYTILEPKTIEQIMPASADEGAEFLLNDVTVTYAYGSYVYVKDATGYMLIYSAIAEAANGKVLQGLQGKAKLYSQLPEISTVTKAPTVTDGSAVAPETLSAYPVAADLNKYVTLEGVTFASATSFSGSVTNETGSFESSDLIFRNTFKLSGVSLTAGTPYRVVGIVQKYNDNFQIYPISFEEIVGGSQVATPTFSPAAGTYTEVQSVTLSCETEDAAIYYTTNGDAPTTSSTLYKGAISVGESMTIKAIAVKDGMDDSNVASATYTINLPADPEVTCTWDLSAESYVADPEPTADLIQWTSTYVTMKAEKNSGGTGVNNYIPPTRTSTRFYTSNKITFIPANSKQITTIVITAATSGYATALKNATWTNATAAASDTEVTITASGAGNVVCVLGANTGITAVTVNYEPYVAPTTYAVSFAAPEHGSLAIANGVTPIASGDEFVEGTELTVSAEPASGYVLDAIKVIETSDPENDVTNTVLAGTTLTVPAFAITISATFVENAAPAATLTLSENGVSAYFPGEHHQGDVVNLPLTSSADCVKDFVGWSTNASCADAPQYAPGAEYTLASTEQTLYAVYATASGSSYVKTALASIASGSEVVVTEAKTVEEVLTTWALTYNTTSKKTIASVVTDAENVLDVAGLTNGFWILTKDGDNFSLTAKGTTDKLYCTNTNDGVRVGEGEANTFSIKDSYIYTSATDDARYLGVYNATDFRCYTSINNNIKDQTLAFYKKTATYSDYATTCVAALADPEFTPAAGVYAEAKNVVITAEDGTIHYTLDGTDPTSSSTEYTAPIVLDKNGTTTIKAIAISATSQSAIVSATYTINLPLSTIQAVYDKAVEVEGIETAVNIKFNNWVVSGISTDNKNVYVTDGEKGFVIYNSDADHDFSVNDKLNGTVATSLKLYNKFADVVGLKAGAEGLTVTHDGVITPVDATIADLGAVNTGAPIILKGVLFDGSVLSDGVNSITPYTTFYADAVTSLESGKYYNITGIYVHFNNTKEIAPRSAEDIQEVDLADPEISYNPASDEITKGEEDSWSAPTLVNPHTLAIASYVSNNEAVATVSDGGLIQLAGGLGTAVITAHTNGNATYGAGNATYTITVNAPAPTPTGTTYRKVTATADITDGEYLIVYETSSVAFDGSLETLDAVGNTVDVTINEGVIAGTAAIDAAVFTIDVTAGSIKSASNKYIGVSSYSNGLSTSDNAAEFENALSIDADGNAVIVITTTGGDMKLRYNSASNQLRFRYYKNDGQQAIQLYKKETPKYSVTYAAGEGSGDAPAAVEYEEGETFTVAAADLFTAPADKEFDKWNDGTNDYAPGDTYTVGTADVVLTAIWKDAAPEPTYETVRTGLDINRFYTVCLPKKVIAIKGASFWTLNNKSQDGATAYLEEETNNLPFAAGKPFIIQATADKLEVVYEGEATETPGVNGAIHGTLTYMDAAALAAAGSDVYMLFSNELRPVGENNHLDANRAYVKVGELNSVSSVPQGAPGKRVVAMPMQKDQAQGFENLDASEKPLKVMIDGTLYILRGEKVYDATGRLVK